jgi:hypothetical protein
VISASSIDDTIAWFANDGAGNFGPEQTISSSQDGARSVTTADVDGDGDLDVVSASNNDDTVAWFENDGAGNFGPEQTISSTQDSVRSVTTADVDGDGDLDVLSASLFDDTVSWFDLNSNYQAIQSVALTFSSTTQGITTVTDDNGWVEITLEVINGTLIGSASGGAIVNGSGTVSLVISGTVSDVNNSLANVSYISDIGYAGIDTLTVTAVDGANNSTVKTNNIIVSVAPVVLDLDGDGLEYSQDILFDMDNDGEKELSAWVGSDDGLLAYDINGDDLITSVNEISFVGYLDGAKTDLEGLAAFDTNENGILDASDADFIHFKVWQDINQNGISEEGELKSLFQAGIESIDLMSNKIESDPAVGVHEFGQGTYTRLDGSEGVLADVSFSVKEMTNDDLMASEVEWAIPRSVAGISEEAIGKVIPVEITVEPTVHYLDEQFLEEDILVFDVSTMDIIKPSPSFESLDDNGLSPSDLLSMGGLEESLFSEETSAILNLEKLTEIESAEYMVKLDSTLLNTTDMQSDLLLSNNVLLDF